MLFFLQPKIVESWDYFSVRKNSTNLTDLVCEVTFTGNCWQPQDPGQRLSDLHCLWEDKRFWLYPHLGPLKLLHHQSHSYHSITNKFFIKQHNLIELPGSTTL